MRKKIWIPMILLTFILLAGCENQNKPPAEPTDTNTAAAAEQEKENMQGSDSENVPVEKLSEEETSEQTVQKQNGSYLEALSDEELEEARNLAEKFYTEEFSYDLISLKPADDTDSLYRNNTDYKPGNIIIFMAETTHAGEGIYRKIVFAREDSGSEWTQINEGY